MSLSISILASGSSGNCSVIRVGAKAVLIDCGIGPRTATKSMTGLGIGIEHLSAICLTHLDSDHFNANWVREIAARNIRIFCHESHRMMLRECIGSNELDPNVECFNGKLFSPLEGIEVRAQHLDHDQTGSFAFRFEDNEGAIGYASDLGRVRDPLLELLAQTDVLAIESNYDPVMQENSGRPAVLQRRIMGGNGHLSNEQSLHAVRKILDRQAQSPKHIVLLHRSRQCNCPDLLRKMFETDDRIAPRLVLAEQSRRTEWLSTGIGCGQMKFDWIAPGNVRQAS